LRPRSAPASLRCDGGDFAFAVVHPTLSFVPVFVLGLVTGALAIHRRSLTACVVAHALYNALALVH